MNSAVLAISRELPADYNDSCRVGLFDARVARPVYDEKFARAFVHMVENPDDKGLMSTHLFYDIPQNRGSLFSGLNYDARTILSGGMAWERRVEEAIQDKTSSGFWSKDHSITSYALKNGLMELLPPGYLKFVSYGGGDIHAFSGNELAIIGRIYDQRSDDIVELCAVDILERFALGCALEARNTYGIRSHGVVGDFIYNGRLAIPDSKGTPVVMIFGGPFENTPALAGNVPSPQDVTALAWAKLNMQHALGTVVIKTCDTNQKPDLENGPYAPSRNFEAFLLSAFARAVQQGVIEDPQYDVFDHWKMTSAFNEATKAVELSATCKKDHAVPIAGQTRHFAKGEQRVFTLSHKWDEQTHAAILQRAGFEYTAFREPGNDNIMLVAKAVRKPDRDLLVQIAAPK